MKKLNPYDLSKGEIIYVLIPHQYIVGTMFIDGQKTKLKTSISSHWVKGTFKGMPKATSGFYFETCKPVDGGLFLIDIHSDIKYPTTAKDMITQADQVENFLFGEVQS